VSPAAALPEQGVRLFLHLLLLLLLLLLGPCDASQWHTAPPLHLLPGLQT
jgi:hypothetical protein